MKSGALFMMITGMWLLPSCDPDLQGICNTNDECVEGYLCDQKNQCVPVDQKKLEILTTKLDDAVTGEEYTHVLLLRGGLDPLHVEISTGPGWMKAQENPETGMWKLTGIPDTYQKDPVAVKLKVTDSSIGDGQTTDSQDLSIRVLHCIPGNNPTEACSKKGVCMDDGLCDCNIGYAGAQCAVCDTEEGYERNPTGECVRYEYKCSQAGVCGANVLRCECVDKVCEDLQDCDQVADCIPSEVCVAGGQYYECNDCEGQGCQDGTCNQCSEGACCDNGNIQTDTTVTCDTWKEYKCSGSACGAQRLEGTFVQKCDGKTSGCNGTTTESWKALSKCANTAICNLSASDTPPVCTVCQHGCANGKCLECDPSKDGCCTPEGFTIQGCWYDKDMKLAWQDPPFEKEMNWEEAKGACKIMELGGKSDWRLPNITELRSLIRGCNETQVSSTSTGICRVLDNCIDKTDCWSEDECDGCKWDEGPNEGCYQTSELNGPCSVFWSTSNAIGPISNAWNVNFGYGSIRNWYSKNNIRTRCVRNGPS